MNETFLYAFYAVVHKALKQKKNKRETHVYKTYIYIIEFEWTNKRTFICH